MNESLAQRIDALLPQTQCTRCGYPDCSSYAQAVASAEAGFNRCPPGGESTIVELARLLGAQPVALDEQCGTHGPRLMARIDEAWCIGCTLCIRACPVDAIVGGAKRMHTVIEALCTGCELCIAPCPVECIDLEPAGDGPRDAQQWLEEQAPLARQRYLDRGRRMAAPRPSRSGASRDDATRRRRLIAQAVQRAKARRAEQAQ